MGKLSRRKWERRRAPTPSYHRPLETRWGTGPLARAVGGMVGGLAFGAGLAAVCLVVGVGRMLFADVDPDLPAGELAWFAGGALLGGAVSGALAPLRGRIGGRRTQWMVMAAVMFFSWTPILNEDGRLGIHDPGAAIAWVLFSVFYGVLFSRVFDDQEPSSPGAQIHRLHPDFRSGRKHKFRP